MSKPSKEHFRHVLPIGSTVRRRLDMDAGEGTSRQPSSEPIPRVTIVHTPRKHEHALRNIRKNVRGLRDQDIGPYLLELQARDLERDAEPRDDSDLEDISPAEDSGDEYQPPGTEREEERERASSISVVSVPTMTKMMALMKKMIQKVMAKVREIAQ